MQSKRRTGLPRSLAGRKFKYDRKTVVQPVEISPRSPHWEDVPEAQRRPGAYHLRPRASGKPAQGQEGEAMNAQERVDLITRTAQWCYDRTECWGHGRLGEGLAYLFWAIAAADGQPFDTTIGPEEQYSELVKLLKANPNGLWDELTASGAIV